MVILQAIIDGVLNAGIFSLAAVSLTLLFGVMKIVNFAHGSFLMLGMYISYTVIQLTGMNPYIGSIISVPIVVVLSLIIYKIVLVKVINVPETTQLIVTLGLALIIENGVLAIYGADFRSVHVASASSVLRLGEIIIPVTRLNNFIVGMGLSLGLYILLRFTDLGVLIRAAVANRTSAMLCGINVNNIMIISMIIVFSLIAIASAWLLPTVYLNPNVGDTYLLPAFIIVILGSLGSVRGAIIGSIIYGLSESLGTAIVPGSLGLLVPLIMFIILLLFKPEGLFKGRI